MKKTIGFLLALATVAAGATLHAATATVVWESDFQNAAKVGIDGKTYTLTLGSTATLNSDGTVSVSSGTVAPITIACSDSTYGTSSVLVKYSGAANLNNAALASMFFPAEGNNGVGTLGVRTISADDLGLKGYFNSNVYPGSGSAVAILPESGYAVMSFKNAEAVHFYAASSLSTLAGGAMTGLSFSGKTITQWGIGGALNRTDLNAFANLKIEKVAIFNGTAINSADTLADIAKYVFPQTRTLAAAATTTAPVPTVVWKGDFGTASKIGSDGATYTLDLNSNNVNEDGNLVIGSDTTYGATITPSVLNDANVTLIVKYKNIGTPETNSVFATVRQSSHETGVRNSQGNDSVSSPRLVGYYDKDGREYSFYDNGAMPDAGYAIFMYSNTGGSRSYFGGSTLKTVDGSSQTGLHFTSDGKISKIALGGGTGNRATFPAWHGLEIEAVAVFMGEFPTGKDKVYDFDFDKTFTSGGAWEGNVWNGSEGWSDSLITEVFVASGAATLSANGETAHTVAALRVTGADGTSLEIDGGSNGITIPASDYNLFDIPVTFKNVTIDFGYTRDFSKITIGEGCTVSLAALATDDGEIGLDLPAGTTINVYNGEAAVSAKTTTGAISYEVQTGGKAAWLAYEFASDFASTGYDTAVSLTSSYASTAFDGEGNLYVGAVPWRDITYPEEWSAAVYCTVPKYTPYVPVVTFGTNTGGLIGLVSGTEENEMLLVRTTSTVKTIAEDNDTILASMKVANAATAMHMYVFTKTANEIKVYCDGKLISSVGTEDAITFGGGLQIGSVHGAVTGMNIKNFSEISTDVFPEEDRKLAKVDFLRMYEGVLGPNAIAQLKAENPYVSPSDTYTLTLADGDSANWSSAAWTKGGESAGAPEKDAIVEVNVTGAATLTMDPSATAEYESLTITGDGTLTLVPSASAGAVEPITFVAGADTVIQTTKANGAALDLTGSRVTVASGKTLTFDYSEAYSADEFERKTFVFDVTGRTTLEDDTATIAVTPPTDATASKIVLDESRSVYVAYIGSNAHYGETLYWIHNEDTLSSQSYVWDSTKMETITKLYDEDVITFDDTESISVTGDGQYTAHFGALRIVDGGALTISGGTLANRTVILEGGSFDVTGGTVTGTLTIDVPEGELTVFSTSAPDLANVTLVKTGAGKLVVDKVATVLAVQVEEGTLEFSEESVAITGTATGDGFLSIPDDDHTVTTTGELSVSLTGSGKLEPATLPTGSALSCIKNASYWTGTIVFTGASFGETTGLNNYGNASSYIESVGCSGYLGAKNETVTPRLTITDNGDTAGLTINNGYSGGCNTITHLNGDGHLNETWVGNYNPSDRILVNDAVNFTGSISISEKYGYYVGASIPEAFAGTGLSGRIAVGSGATATLGTNATWTAAAAIDIVGTLNARGGTLVAPAINIHKGAVLNYNLGIVQGARVTLATLAASGTITGIDDSAEENASETIGDLATLLKYVTINVNGKTLDTKAYTVEFRDGAIRLKSKSAGLSLHFR